MSKTNICKEDWSGGGAFDPIARELSLHSRLLNNIRLDGRPAEVYRNRIDLHSGGGGAGAVAGPWDVLSVRPSAQEITLRGGAVEIHADAGTTMIEVGDWGNDETGERAPTSTGTVLSLYPGNTLHGDFYSARNYLFVETDVLAGTGTLKSDIVRPQSTRRLYRPVIWELVFAMSSLTPGEGTHRVLSWHRPRQGNLEFVGWRPAP